MSNNNVDLIDQFVEIVSKYIDAPPEFIEAGGYAVISSLLGRYYRTTWVPSIGRPNLWIIISSFSGRFRRSTLQGCVEYVYRRVMKELLKDDPELSSKTKQTTIEPDGEEGEEDREEEKKPISIDELVEDTIIEEGSPEGIIDHIGDTPSDVYHICSTEFGGVLDKMYGDGYEQGTGVLLSKLAYGEGGSVYLSKRGGKAGKRTLRSGLYVDAFCGMQEPELYLTEMSIRQGLVRRLLIINEQSNPSYKPPINEDRPKLYQELSEYVELVLVKARKARDGAKANEKLLRSKYWNMDDVKFIDVTIHQNVEKAINDYDEKITKEVDKNPSLKNIARQSLWEHLAKLSMCREIACSDIQEDATGVFYVLVHPSSHEKALTFLNKVDASSEYLDRIGEKKEVATDVKLPIDRLYGLILNSMPDGISKSKLLKMTRWKTDELKKYIDTLVEREQIKEYTKVTGGRIAYIYKVAEEQKQ